MQFTFIETLGIRTDFAVLNRDTQPYCILLYQHEGNLQADSNAIQNTTDVVPQLQAFLAKALETNVDLALTPEYCCPWSVIDFIIKNPAQWPRTGKLWVYGCVSITKDQLQEFYSDHLSQEVFIHFEDTILQKDKNYLDPLVYIFRGIHQEQPKLIVLIQFKTSHMGVWGNAIERDNLIEGNTIYILRNSTTSIHFFSLICSEAMNFKDAMTPTVIADLNWHDIPYLIFNPQLNPSPTHSQFCDFRKFVLSEERKELICLNWANTSQIMGRPLLPDKSSRSGFFIKSQEVDLSHDRIKHNHIMGMYYFNFEHHKHTYILNSTVNAFLVQNLPVHITEGLSVQRRREGPKTILTFSFHSTNKTLQEFHGDVSDSHLQYLHEAGCTCAFLINPAGCILEKEMLVSLTSGKIYKVLGQNWNNVLNLYSLQSSEQTEYNHRITYTEDINTTSVSQRSQYIDAINELEYNVFPHPELFPESLKDLKNKKLRIGYINTAQHDNYKYNVINGAGEREIATICFLGSAPQSIIGKVFNYLQGIFDKDHQNRSRVVIFYRFMGNIHSMFDSEAGRITSSAIYGNESILK
jgi:hypothetical protein